MNTVYCPTCGEPISKTYEVNGRAFEMKKLICSCQQDRIDLLFDGIRQHEEDLGRIAEGYLDPVYAAYTWQKDDSPESKASIELRRYTEKWKEMLQKNQGLVFMGNVGSGKTYYASCIANAVRRAGYRVLIGTMPKLLDEMSRDFGRNRPRFEEKIQNCALMVIDDFGTERVTDANLELTYEIIDLRNRAQKPLIITTNLSKDDIDQGRKSDERKDRIWSRIGGMCKGYVIKGEDRRAEIGRKKALETQRILSQE